MARIRRRWLLASAAGVAAALAGCATDGSDSSGPGEMDGDGQDAAQETDTPTDTEGSPSPTPTEGGERGTATDGTGSNTVTTTATRTPSSELDLREANVTGVSVAAGSGSTVEFDVTLFHDDEGEDGYANWWQVETRDGERLGRRELLHAHGTREFTRSAEIEVPEGVDCVVVRGHDQTHGYGGQAALVTVGTGTVRFVGQGSERVAVAGPCP